MMKNSEYQKRQDGNKTIFDVTPASCPKHKAVIYMSLPIILIMLVVFFPVAILVAVAVWYFGFRRDWRPVAHRAPSTFSVSSSEIESNGRTFKKEDIHRLIIKNGMTQNELAGAVIASGRPGMGAYAIGQDYRAKISAVTNALDLESGGNAHTLAGGMSETTAFGLMTDVSKTLGLQTA